jgi:excisionase family DNA binding protein
MVEKVAGETIDSGYPVKVYSIKEAAKELGISRTWMYYLIQTKRIKSRKIGAQYTVSQAEIDRYRDGNNNSSK